MDVAVAWAAGLFEGEGCLHIERLGLIKATLSSTDEDTVERFGVTIGVGAISSLKRPPHKDQWVWNAHGDDAVAAIKLMLPWFCARRTERAKELLDSRAALIAEATRERRCPECGCTFVAAFNPGWRLRKYCSQVCSLRFNSRRGYWRRRDKILAQKRAKYHHEQEAAMERVRELT